MKGLEEERYEEGLGEEIRDQAGVHRKKGMDRWVEEKWTGGGHIGKMTHGSW